MVKENLIEGYEKSFRENWNRPALSDYFKKGSYTYGQMAEEIIKLHMLFQKLDIKRGDKIALIGRNNTRWCIAYMATITYGAIIVPILQDFNPNDVQHIINHSDSVLMFSGDIYWDTLDPANLKNLRVVLSLTDYSILYEREGYTAYHYQQKVNRRLSQRFPNGFSKDDVHFAKVNNADVVLISYTSGTTGFTKGVMTTANNLAGNVQLGTSSGYLHPGSRMLSFLPLAHAYGCMFEFLYPLRNGSHITLLGKIPAPKIIVEAFSKVRPNLVICVPMILEKIYKKQILPLLERPFVGIVEKLPILKKGLYSIIRNKLMKSFGGEFAEVIIGGATLNREVEEFLDMIHFPYTVGYGMTECAPLICYSKHEDFRMGTCGKVLEGLMEAKIDSPNPESIPGEIIVRGEHVMKGYYKNPEATEQALDGEWLHTGDLGIMSSDNVITIKGRCKTMILGANGQNIYPEEIESKLNNMPCVLESLVLEREGKLVALVCPDYEQISPNNTNTEDIQKVMEENRKNLNKLVATYEAIQSIILYPKEFEKTPKKSIKRYLYQH